MGEGGGQVGPGRSMGLGWWEPAVPCACTLEGQSLPLEVLGGNSFVCCCRKARVGQKSQVEQDRGALAVARGSGHAGMPGTVWSHCWGGRYGGSDVPRELYAEAAQAPGTG